MMYTSRSNSDMCFVDRDKSLTDIDVEIVDGAVRNRVNRYNRYSGAGKIENIDTHASR